jgi:hypothetical protein
VSDGHGREAQDKLMPNFYKNVYKNVYNFLPRISEPCMKIRTSVTGEYLGRAKRTYLVRRITHAPRGMKYPLSP